MNNEELKQVINDRWLDIMTYRNREWIHKPTFSSVPVSYVNEYLRNRLNTFRKEHNEFDMFLNEIGKLLDKRYKNLLKFINNEAEGNWISPKKSMFDIFIKLFNLCLSPKQAVNYINECYKTYLKMLYHHYRLSNTYSVSIKRSRYDGKVRKIIDIDVYSHNGEYYFNVNFSSLVIFDPYYCDMHISIIGKDDRYEDVLSLFEYHQENKRSVLKNLRHSLLSNLKDKGIIKEISKRDCFGYTGVEYLAEDDVGL